MGAKSGKVCKVCLQTAEFAPSSVNAASCRLGVLHEKQNACPPSPLAGSLVRVFWGLKGGKKGGFTSDSSNTPLGRRIDTNSPHPKQDKGEAECAGQFRDGFVKITFRASPSGIRYVIV